MTLRELYDLMSQQIESSADGSITFEQDGWPQCEEITEFLRKLGCMEYTLQDCSLGDTEGDGIQNGNTYLEGLGRLFEEQPEIPVKIDFVVSEGRICIEAYYSYCGVYFALRDICSLPVSMWDLGSVVGLRESSVLQGVILFDPEVMVNDSGCYIRAGVSLSECKEIMGQSEEFPMECPVEYPFDALLPWQGNVENPAGGRDKVKIWMKSEPFPCGEPMPMVCGGGDGYILPVQNAYMQFQTHRIDERLLQNYVQEEGNLEYVSCADYGYEICTPDGTVCEMFYTLGTLVSTAEFCSDGGAVVPDGPQDKFICHLLDCEAGMVMGDVIAKLGELIGVREEGAPEGSVPSWSVVDRVVDVQFRRVHQETVDVFVLDSIYFIYDIKVSSARINTDWTVEGYLPRHNIYTGNLDGFELTASMRDLSRIMPVSLFRNASLFRHTMTSIDANLSRFSTETCYPIGEPPEPEPEPDLEEFAGEFSDLDEGFLMTDSEGREAASALKVPYFKIEGNLQDQVLYVELTVDTSAVLKFRLGEFEVALREITGYLNYTPQNVGVGLSGTLRMGFTDAETFDLFMGGSYESGGEGEKGIWSFEAGLLKGVVSLSDIINRIMGWNLSLSMEVTAFYITYTTRGTYSVLCKVSTKLPLFGGMMEITVMADVRKQDPQGAADVVLSGEVVIQYFLFAVLVHLYSDSRREYQFTLRFDEILVNAVYEVPAARKAEYALMREPCEEKDGGVLTVSLENFTIGSMLKALFKVLRPNENFKLPKPWDILNRIGLPKLKIVYHVDTGDIQVTLPLGIDLLLLTVDEVGFTYQNREGESDEKFNILIRYHWLVPYVNGEDDEGVYLWDAFHSPAPGPVAESSRKFFVLKYFGIGRHIDLGLDGVGDMPLSELLKVCKKHVKGESSVPADKYNADYGWFIGAQFTLLEFLDVSLLFCDPMIYGLQAVVLNNDVVPLKGLDITIYYRKVTEDIGLFYLNAGLPDIIKHMEFGMLSITLPSIELWIYTNGNFKVNFGFPAGGDFSGAFALSYGIFYGRGGFYFGYLSGDTSSNVPDTDRGYFNPVIELGIGITVGVGRSFNFGILKLRAELELTGIFEGVFAKFHSPDEKIQEMYYRCTGTVIIAGEISGEVNFLIIQAGFRICARASLSASLESGESTVLVMEASFSVSAYVKIWIIKISFHFSYTYRDSFELGKSESKPWKNEMLTADDDGYVYDWTPVELYAEKLQMTAMLMPYYSKDNLRAAWSGNGFRLQEGGEEEREAEKIACLMVMGEGDFTRLVMILLTFAVGAQKRPEPESVSSKQLRDIMDELEEETCTAFSLEKIYELLNLNLVLSLEAAPCSVNDRAEDGERMYRETGEENRIPMPFPPAYRVVWSVRKQGEEEEFDEIACNLDEIDEAKQIFEEYIRLVVKSGLSRAVEYAESREMQGNAAGQGDGGSDGIPVAGLLDYIRGHIGEISGMVSRFLLHGSRRAGRPLYDVICQQFAGLARGGWEENDIVHRLVLTKVPGDMAWLGSETAAISIAEGDLDYPQGTMNVCFIHEPSKLPADAMEKRTAALFDCQAVYYEDHAQFYLWKMPEEIWGLDDLQIRAWQIGELQDGGDNEVLEYCHAALLDITVRRQQEDEDVYAVISAAEETREWLKLLAEAGEQRVVRHVRLLFGCDIKKSEEQKPKGAYYFDEDRDGSTWLIRQNLSEITAAPQRMLSAGGQSTEDCVCLGEDGAEPFFRLLYQMVLTGGDGHYIRIGGNSLGSEIFADDGLAVLHFLLEVDAARWANRILLYEDIDSSMVPVAEHDALGERCLSVMGPGKIGFEMTVAGADEEVLQKNQYNMNSAEEKRVLRDNLTNQAFSLLYYRLDGEESLPLSMQDSDHGCYGNYYSHIMNVPHYPSPVREIEGTVNPYAGILPEGYAPGQNVQLRDLPITFYFADILGNSIGRNYGYKPVKPITLTYTDSLLAITELPMTQVSYRIVNGGEEGQFMVRLSMMSEAGESVERMRNRCGAIAGMAGGEQEEIINLEQFSTAYYQYAQPDVVFRLCVQFGTVYDSTVEWEKEQKEAVCSYLFRLYDYASAVKEGTECVPPDPVQLEFAMDQGDFLEELDELVLGRISVSVIVERDRCYVEKSGRLPNMVMAVGEAGADRDLEGFCEEFEQVFAGARLLVEDGLYGAFFPRGALKICAPDACRLFYALRPFSTKLDSRAGMKLTKLSDRISGGAEPDEVSYLDIDLEVWVREFFAFYERLLQPGNLGYLLGVGEEAGKIIQKLLETKRELALMAAGHAEGVFLDEQGETTSVPEAQDCLCDMMWKNLADGYEAAGAAAYAQTDRLGSFALAGVLFGVPGVQGGKILPGAGYFCMQAAPVYIEASGTISMSRAEMQFTHLEDQLSGQWYRFIRPFESVGGYVDAEFGMYGNQTPVVLPVPLRKYPESPELVFQKADGTSRELGKLAWSYTLSVNVGFSAQDRLYVILSTGQSLPCNAEDAGEDLFGCLAQFIYDEEEYGKYLVKPAAYNENDIRSRENVQGEPSESVLAALEDFSQQAERIAGCWNTVRNQVQNEFGFAVWCSFAGGRLDKVYLQAGEKAFSDGVLYPEGLLYPVLIVTDQSGQSAEIALSGEQMFYEIPEEIQIAPGDRAEYMFRIEGISIYDCQGLRSEVYLKRNEEFEVLPGEIQPVVNPGFIYETPRTGFKELVHPYISLTDEYNAGKFDAESALNLIRQFITESLGVLTELTVWIGQRVQGGQVVYRPVKRLVRRILSEDTAKTFMREASAVWSGMSLEGQGKYFVKLGIVQSSGEENVVILVNVDNIVFYL